MVESMFCNYGITWCFGPNKASATNYLALMKRIHLKGKGDVPPNAADRTTAPIVKTTSLAVSAHVPLRILCKSPRVVQLQKCVL